MTVKIVKAFEELVIEAVKEQKEKIRSPQAIFLSGGLDSGLVAAISCPDLALICRVPCEKKYDEFDYATRVADHLKLKYEIVEANQENFKASLKKAVQIIGTPTPHFSIYPLYLLFEKVNKLGINHVLMGNGGDELLGGYARNLITKLIADLYSLPELENYSPLLKRAVGTPIEVYSRIANPKRTIAELASYWDNKKDVVTNMNNIDLEMQMTCQTEMTEKIAGHFGITIHSPFMNQRVIDFCLNLPGKYKIRGNTTKWIEREVAKKYLPREIVERKVKIGGPVVPVNLWMGWLGMGEYGKEEYLKYQEEILDGRK